MQLMRNPRRSSREMARELDISSRSMSRILQDRLQVKAYKMFTDLRPLKKREVSESEEPEGEALACGDAEHRVH